MAIDRSDARLGEASTLGAESRRPIVVQVTKQRSLIGAPHREELAGSFEAIGIARRRHRRVTRELDRRLAGAIEAADGYVATQIVISDDVSIPVAPSVVVRLSHRRPTVKARSYTVAGRGAVHLRWTENDEARVERYEDFVLVAWTSRLVPAKAFGWALKSADAQAEIAVDTLERGYDNPNPTDLRRIASRPELLRLIRVENEDMTLIWELRWGGAVRLPVGERAIRRAQPTHGGFLANDPSQPEIVLMADVVNESTVKRLIEETASTSVAMNAGDIIRAL